MPHSSESFEILKADEHAEIVVRVTIRGSWGIDKDPEMVISETRCFVSAAYAWDFPFASDVLDCFGPWCCYLDEDVVLEYFLGFVVDLAVGEENV